MDTNSRGLLWGYDDTPFRHPIPGRPIGRPGIGHLRGIIGVFSYYQLVDLFFNIIRLIMEFTNSEESRDALQEEFIHFQTKLNHSYSSWLTSWKRNGRPHHFW
jgi:hypothetical protein